MCRLTPFCLFFLACGMTLGQRPVSAQQAVGQEYQIKAGYFAYFGQYISWPNPPLAAGDEQFVIAILGRNSFGQHLRRAGAGFVIDTPKFSTNKIQGKSIKVVEYPTVANFNANYQPCHILFVSRFSASGVLGETVQDRVNAALQMTKGKPVLLVADAVTENESRSFAKAGAIISYWNNRTNNRVEMVINRQAERKAKLAIKARFLGLSLVTVLN